MSSRKLFVGCFHPEYRADRRRPPHRRWSAKWKPRGPQGLGSLGRLHAERLGQLTDGRLPALAGGEGGAFPRRFQGQFLQAASYLTAPPSRNRRRISPRMTGTA